MQLNDASKYISAIDVGIADDIYLRFRVIFVRTVCILGVPHSSAHYQHVDTGDKAHNKGIRHTDKETGISECSDVNTTSK